MSTWFKCNKLSLGISKTNFIHFKTNNSHKIDSNLMIDGLPLIEKNYTMFLGVTIDSNLTWKEHINNIHTSISRYTILYKLKEFLSEKSLLILYNSLILSHINYCNIVWGKLQYNQDSLLLQK